MMFRYLSIILLALVSISLYAKENKAKMTTYSNSKMHYSIQYPSDWKQNVEFKDFDIFIMAPENEKGHSLANMSIISGELPKEISLEKFAKENIKQLLNDNASMKIKSEGKVKVADLLSYRISYTRSDNDTEIIQYFFVKNNIGYLITFGAQQDVFNNYRNDFDAIVESIRISSKIIKNN